MSHKLTTIVYAQGFIEDYIENETEPIAVLEERNDDEEYMNDLEAENEHREQVRAMWKVVSEGLDQLRRENASLINKLALIDIARNTQT